MRIGVLCVQGAFAEHIDMLKTLGCTPFEIRQLSDWQEDMDGLIIPGGESTVMGKLLNQLGIMEKISHAISRGLPVFGTCAGMILLSKNILNDEHVYLSAMDTYVLRNAYGRQLGSFQTTAHFEGIGQIPMVFIRAPYIEKVDAPAKALAIVGGHIVAARQGNILATAFHPELTGDTKVHKYFLDMCARKQN